ncbi:hypothetical protein [Bradyrhizobium sp. Leo121]|uniref:hypothetical protein n=1 Tax=Bradyrhizobium sp. Leo121 TaxID=1571195 RepID=UPI0013EF3EC1|nr:hypothetical protein [Bradyrhizobium sp. Leo121]
MAEFQHFPDHGFCCHRPVLGKDFAYHYQPRAAQFIPVKVVVTRYRQNIPSATINATL